MAIVGRTSATPKPGYNYDPSTVSMGNIYGQVKSPTAAPNPYGGYVNAEQQDLARYNEQERRRRERMQYDASVGAGGGSYGGSTSTSRSSVSALVDPAERARKDAMFERIMGMFNSQSTPAKVSRVSGPSAAQEKAVRDASFARAKEQAGQTARASMSALDDVVAEQGLMGSSIAAAKQGAIVGGAASNITDFLTRQAQEEADRATHVADIEYQGQVAQRNAEIGRQQQMQSALLGLLGGLY